MHTNELQNDAKLMFKSAIASYTSCNYKQDSYYGKKIINKNIPTNEGERKTFIYKFKVSFIFEKYKSLIIIKI